MVHSAGEGRNKRKGRRVSGKLSFLQGEVIMREIMIAAVRDLKEHLLAQRQRCAKCSMNVCDLEVPACRVI
ncbi:hypothetical protein METP3_02336 [Methanosarcinales archaeon]|nr:hypothetical protein METP3_02336 [Methanosarcinales archaeon]